MRKYLFVVLILTCAQMVFSQTVEEIVRQQMQAGRRQIDSLKKILLTAKGSNKVDCLNALTKKALDLPLGSWQAEADTARPYAVQANKEAKRIGYKKGLGDSYVNLETIDCMMFGTYAQVQKRFDTVTFNSAQQNAKNAIAIGEELNDHNMLGETYLVLDWLLGETKSTGDYKQYIKSNIEYIRNAIEQFSKTENKNRLARSYEEYFYLLGNTDTDFEIREEAMKKAILLYRETANGRESLACTNLVENYLQLGDFENGFIYCKRVIELAEEDSRTKPPVQWQGYPYVNAFALMGRLYIAAGDYETALHYVQKAHDFAEPNDSFFLKILASQLGEVYQLMGKYDSASYYLVPIEKNSEWTGRIGWGAKLRLIDLYISLKQYDKALPILLTMIEKTKDFIAKSTDRFAIGILSSIYTKASKVYSDKKDYPAALMYANEGLKLSLNTKRRLVIIDNYQIHSDIFSNQGKYDSAFYYLKRFTVLRDSLINRQFYWRLNSYKKQAEEERKTSQINLLNKDNQLKEQKIKQQAIVKNGLIIGILLLFLLGVFVSRSYYLKRKKQQAENKNKQTELEMQALRAQMNPHFIFNCLSSINKYILKNEPDTASDYLTRFSRLIRMVLMNSQRSLITLEDELDMLTIYLDMERMRFKNAFNYNIIFANRVDADAIFIPPLLLQPFCENAIWHGLKPLADGQQGIHEPGRLDIVLSMEGKVLNCSITDNGIGRKKAAEIRSKSAEEKKSLGLKITAERLALLNQEKNAFTCYEIEDLEDEGGNAVGTKVNLKISYKETVEEYVFSPSGTNGG